MNERCYDSIPFKVDTSFAAVGVCRVFGSRDTADLRFSLDVCTQISPPFAEILDVAGVAGSIRAGNADEEDIALFWSCVCTVLRSLDCVEFKDKQDGSFRTAEVTLKGK